MSVALVLVISTIAMCLLYYGFRVLRRSPTSINQLTRGRILAWLRERTGQVLCLSLLLTAFGDVLQLPWTQSRLDGLVGAHITWPLKWVFVATGALFFQFFAIQISISDIDNEAEASAARRTILYRSIACATCLVVAILLFSTHPGDSDFMVGPRSRSAIPGRVPPTVGLTWLVLIGWYGFSAATLANRTRRWAIKTRTIGQGTLRAGVIFLSIAVIMAFIYCINVAAFQILEMADYLPPFPQQTISNPMIAGSPFVASIGLVLPAIGARRATHQRNRAALRELEPLLSILPLSAAQRMQRRSSLARWWHLRRPRQLLQQQIISLWDTLTLLRPSISSKVLALANSHDDVAALTEVQRRSFNDALIIVLAIHDPIADISTFTDQAKSLITSLAIASAHSDPADQDSEVALSLLSSDTHHWLRVARIIKSQKFERTMPKPIDVAHRGEE